MQVNKQVLFWQPAGIGDIFFLQKAARHFISLGYEVIWPVIPEFLYIKDYIKGINFVNVNENFPRKECYKTPIAINTEEFVYIPFDISHHRFGVLPMKGKYLLMQFMGFDVNENNWKDYLQFERNQEREIRCKEILGIKNEPFIFVNNMFASPPDMVYREVNITNSNIKCVYHKPEHIKLFNVFDLCWVIENALEIHTVETSLCYLVENLNTKGKLNMYSRKVNGRLQNPDFSYVDHIYKKDWNYIV
jgi:hypothetical protein